MKNPNYKFYIHDDMEMLQGKYPLCFLINANVFIMQESRIVFIGNKFTCKNWIKINENKFCEQLPLFKN